MKRRSCDTETGMGQPQGEWGKGNFEKVTLCHFAKDLLLRFERHAHEK